METTQNLTREQRRMIVEHMATECVQEMPSEDMPSAAFYRDLHSEHWRLQTMKAIEKVFPEADWNELLERLEQYQSFDRNPEQWMDENDYEDTAESVREYLNDEISLSIDVVARY